LGNRGSKEVVCMVDANTYQQLLGLGAKGVGGRRKEGEQSSYLLTSIL